jgi:hypothetical protein
MLGLLTNTALGPVGAGTAPPNSNGTVGQAWDNTWIGVYSIDGIAGNVLCADNDVHTYPTGSFGPGSDVGSSGDASAIAYLLNHHGGTTNPDTAAAIDAANSKWGIHTSSADYATAVSHGLGDLIDAIMVEGRANAGPYTTTISGLVQHGGGGRWDTTYTATVHVASAAGFGVAGQPVTLATANVNVSTNSLVTDAAGNATFTYSIPSSGGTSNYAIAPHTNSPVLVQYPNLNGNQPVVGYRPQDTSASFEGGVDPLISANIIKYAEGDVSKTPVAGATFKFTASDGSVLGSITTTTAPLPLAGMEPGATYTVTETEYTGAAGLYIPVAASNGYSITIPLTASDGYQLAFANPATPVVAIVTQANYQSVETNVVLTDKVTVTGNDGENGTITGVLHGPASVPESGKCADVTALAWAQAAVVGTFTTAVNGVVNSGNGDYVVIGSAPTAAGCYGWTETIMLAPSDASASSPPTAASESTLVIAPSIATQISLPVAMPGHTLHDTITFAQTGTSLATPPANLGTATVRLAYLPFPGASTICADITALQWKDFVFAHPSAVVKTETLVVPANGTLVSGDYVVPPSRVGCYSYEVTFHSALAPSSATVSEFGAATETATVIAPVVTTQMSANKVTDTALVIDTITVTGLHGLTGTLSGVLLGPVTPNLAGTCDDVTYNTAVFVGSFGDLVADHDGSDYVTTSVSVTPGLTACYTGYEFLTIGGRVFYTPTPGEITETVLASTAAVGAGSGSLIINTGNPGSSSSVSLMPVIAGSVAILFALAGGGLLLLGTRRRRRTD